MLETPFLRVHRRIGQLLGVHLAESLELLDGPVFRVAAVEDRGHLGVGERPLLPLALLEAVQRRLRDVDIAALDQLPHLPVEERQQQRADVRAVDVGVGHDDDLVIAQLVGVEFLAEAGSQRGDHGADLFVREHLVQTCFLDVEDLAAQRQDRLRIRIAAALGGAAGRIAFDQEDLRERGVLRLAVDQLARQPAALEHVLTAGQIARFLGGFACARGLHALVDDRACDLRIFLEEEIEPLADQTVDDRADLGVAKLGLRLAFELRVLQLDRDDRGQPLHAVVGREVGVHLLEHAALAAVLVDFPRHGGAEAGQMHPALHRVDVVGVRVHDFVVAVLPLQRALDDDVFAFAVGRDDRGERFFVLVEPVDERDDPALVAVDPFAQLVAALVAQRDLQPAVEEGQLAQPVLEDLPRELQRLEHRGVGLEPLVGPAALGPAELLQLLHGRAALEGDLPLPAVAPHPGDHFFRERVDDRDADAVQAARNLVAALAEFAARVEHRHDDLDRRQAFFRNDVERNAAAVVLDRARAVFVEHDPDRFGVARQRFVHRVVDGFVDQLVESALGRIADVHPGALANSLEAFKDLDLFAGIVVHSNLYLRREGSKITFHAADQAGKVSISQTKS